MKRGLSPKNNSDTNVKSGRPLPRADTDNNTAKSPEKLAAIRGASSAGDVTAAATAATTGTTAAFGTAAGNGAAGGGPVSSFRRIGGQKSSVMIVPVMASSMLGDALSQQPNSGGGTARSNRRERSIREAVARLDVEGGGVVGLGVRRGSGASFDLAVDSNSNATPRSKGHSIWADETRAARKSIDGIGGGGGISTQRALLGAGGMAGVPGATLRAGHRSGRHTITVGEVQDAMLRAAAENNAETSTRTIKTGNRPKIHRHATQLDMLKKLKKLAPFDREMEHEFLVVSYGKTNYRGTAALSLVCEHPHHDGDSH